MSRTTPVMAQYQRIKARHPGTILLFRLGDFYEMFSEDALLASRILEIALTARGKGTATEVPMCGVPVHSADRYISRLLRSGHKVAICEQLQDAEEARGLVERDVVRVVTPGTDVDDRNLDSREHNWLASVVTEGARAGVALLDLSTGDFQAVECPVREAEGGEEGLAAIFQRFCPREALHPEGLAAPVGTAGTAWSPVPPWTFGADAAERALREQFGVASLEGLGVAHLPLGVRAAGAILHYLRETQKTEVRHVQSIRAYDTGRFLRLDEATVRNLEIVRSLRGGGREGTLLDLVDRTCTAMGARLLRRRLLEPLRDAGAIRARLDAVEEMLEETRVRATLRDSLRRVQDLERLLSRISLRTANPRDLAAFRSSLQALPEIAVRLRGFRSEILAAGARAFDPLEDLCDLLSRGLVESPPLSMKEGGLVRDGFDAELDSLKAAARDGREFIAGLETRERERTGISSLKVRYSQVFGYAIEVSKSNLGRVPGEYVRKQTLLNAERFITPELKDAEAKVLGAQERIAAREYDLFCGMRDRIAAAAGRIQATAALLADLDAHLGLAEAAERFGWTRPEVHEGETLRILEGRHPIVEVLRAGEPFVPNDAFLDPDRRQVVILTGPNMGGKSTWLRQVALIALLAHVGSFVPAKEAEIGLLDRIFTRVGAADHLAAGQSTFMVEMIETANILRAATRRSLVVLDEVGRGTATFDGLSLAWAVVEFIHGVPGGPPGLGAKTLFATHYHELTELARTLERVVNLRIAVREWEGQIVFLRTIEEGSADQSYGIHVARLAGLPGPVVDRAREILANLEKNELDPQGRPRLAEHREPGPETPGRGAGQMSLFDPPPHPVLEEIRSLDLDAMTPREALETIYRIRERLRLEGGGGRSE